MYTPLLRTGSTVALHAAAQTSTRQVILLNGVGVTPGEVYRMQQQFQLPLSQVSSAACTAMCHEHVGHPMGALQPPNTHTLHAQIALAKAKADNDQPAIALLEAEVAAVQCTIDNALVGARVGG